METKRFLKKFDNQNDYESQKDSVMETPYVVLLEDTKEVIYSFDANSQSDPFNGHEYVDLGLPSGTLWATKNVGAESEEDFGLYFAWGNTEGATFDEIESGEVIIGTMGVLTFGTPGNMDKHKNRDTIYTKYNETDEKTVLDLEDDAAHVHMGGDWHMPTNIQCAELIENTTSTLMTKNDVNGILLTSKINGESVFIPNASYADLNGIVKTYPENTLDGCRIWTSSISSFERNAVYFNTSTINVSTQLRSDGLLVRGVV